MISGGGMVLPRKNRRSQIHYHKRRTWIKLDRDRVRFIKITFRNRKMFDDGISEGALVAVGEYIEEG